MALKIIGDLKAEVDTEAGTVTLREKYLIHHADRPRGILAACVWLNAQHFDGSIVYFYELRGASQRVMFCYVAVWDPIALEYNLCARYAVRPNTVHVGMYSVSNQYNLYGSTMLQQIVEEYAPEAAMHYEIGGAYVPRSPLRWPNELTYTIKRCDPHVRDIARKREKARDAV